MTINYEFDFDISLEEEGGVPSADNNSTSADFFEQRKLYKAKYEEFSLVSPIDLSIEKRLYGRLDTKGNAIYPLKKKSIIVNELDGRKIDGVIDIFRSFKNDDTGETMFAMNFVVDAFLRFRNYYRTARIRGAIREDVNPSIFSIEPVRAWSDGNAAYNNYLKGLGEVTLERALKQNIITLGTGGRKRRILNFKSFIDFFVDTYVDTHNPAEVPMTKCGYLTSSDLSVLNTGLAIDIADDDRSDDRFKYENYLNDDNFDFYTQAALRFGFRVDLNAPWTLVADLNSKYMREKMREYDIDSVQVLFQEYYKKAYLDDLQNIQEFFFVFYNQLVDVEPTTTLIKEKGTGTVAKLVDRKKISEDRFLLNYPLVFWYNLYVRIRMAEMGGLDPLEYKKIKSKVIKYGNTLDKDAMMGYINRQLMNCGENKGISY